MTRAVRHVAVLSLALLGCSGDQPTKEANRPADSTEIFDEEARISRIPDRYKPLFEPGLGDDERTALMQNLPYDSISLSRSPCYGTCPVYSVTFHRTGKAELDATEFLPKVGKFAAEINLNTYGRLCYFIEDSRFRELKPDYHAPWTDDTTCVVTVTEGDRQTRVSDYGEVGPIELWAIQSLIDAVRNELDWKPVP